MSNLSKADRDKLPASAFALPSKRLYPILDQDDVDSAARLIGKHPEAKAGVIRLAKAKGLKIPDAWKTADMSASASEEMVIKRGKIFTAGDYPDVEGGPFSITPEELFAETLNFVGAPLRDTHREQQNSLLRGRLGVLKTVELDPNDPYNLLGEVAIPKWLDEGLQGTEIGVSAEWNRRTKRLEGLALVTDPRISDAALFAAFSAASQGAPGAAQPHSGTEARTSMSWTEKLSNWIKGGMEGEAPVPESSAVAAPVAFSSTPTAATPDPELAALKARVAASEAENIRLRQEGIADRARSFYAAEFAAHRVVPAEQEAVIAAFTQAATDDATHGVVTFSEGTTRSRLDLLRAQYAARPANVLTQELISAAGVTPEDATALFNQQITARAGAEKPADPNRVKAFLGSSTLGRAALNGHQN